jgi:hypothetical protein
LGKEVNTWILTTQKVNQLDKKAFLMHSKNIYFRHMSSQIQMFSVVLKVTSERIEKLHRKIEFLTYPPVFSSQLSFRFVAERNIVFSVSLHVISSMNVRRVWHVEYMGDNRYV